MMFAAPFIFLHTCSEPFIFLVTQDFSSVGGEILSGRSIYSMFAAAPFIFLHVVTQDFSSLEEEIPGFLLCGGRNPD